MLRHKIVTIHKLPALFIFLFFFGNFQFERRIAIPADSTLALTGPPYPWVSTIPNSLRPSRRFFSDSGEEERGTQHDPADVIF